MDNSLSNKSRDDDFANYFRQFYEQLRMESERGSAIVGAAFIEEALEKMLKALLIASAEKAEKDDELFKSSYSPLGSFSAKIDVAYRTGLISPKVWKSLHIIRDLRNDFAHLSLQIDCETQSVRDRIRNLFNLNKELFETLWQILQDNFKNLIVDNKSMHGIENVVKNLGWKSTYEVLISIIAGTLLVEKNRTPKIVSHHRD
ncbi:MAG: DUF4145 domain-containing protein [Nitrospirae bacterium]|nr:DUF4145 domain-containing protein [Nitrospirota bacterium]